MSYLVPSEFVTKMVDAGESKIFMSTRDTVIRAYMAGAILALAAWFAVTINVNTGQPIVGALLFPGRLFHALSTRLRPLDRRVRSHAACVDRQAAGRNALRRFAKLGSRLYRQFRRRAHGRLHDGVRDDFRLHTGLPTRSAPRSAMSARPARSAMQPTARPAWRRCSSAACSATGWYPPAWSAP